MHGFPHNIISPKRKRHVTNSAADFCQFKILIEIIERTLNNKLKVSNKNFLTRLGNFITHPITATIAFILTVLGVVLAIIKIF